MLQTFPLRNTLQREQPVQNWLPVKSKARKLKTGYNKKELQ